MARIILFGTGRGAEVAYQYLSRDAQHEICAFTVDRAYRTTDRFHGLPVVDFESVETIFPPDDFCMFALLGYQRMNRLRQQKYQMGKEKGYRFISYLSPRISTPPDFSVGENCFILDNQTIDLGVRIGNNVVIWSWNHIGDQSQIMDHVWLSSGICLSGNVTIRPFSFIGIGAKISNNVTIQDESFIGAGAVILKDTVPRGVYIVPGTPIAPMPSDRFLSIVERPV